MKTWEKVTVGIVVLLVVYYVYTNFLSVPAAPMTTTDAGGGSLDAMGGGGGGMSTPLTSGQPLSTAGVGHLHPDTITPFTTSLLGGSQSQPTLSSLPIIMFNGQQVTSAGLNNYDPSTHQAIVTLPNGVKASIHTN